MLMYPKEYIEFSELIKKYIVLNILIKVLAYDRKVIRNTVCKLAKVYDEAFEEIELQIEYDLRQLKKKIRELGGTIIEEQQQPSVRVVKAKFRGFIYTHRFLNYVLQAESERMLRNYLGNETNKKESST